MTFDEFDKIKARFQELEHKITDTKGKEYANSEDRLGNFKRVGTTLDIPTLKVAYVYFKKHLDAIEYVINGKKELSESFEQRILDARVYLILIYAIHIENEEKKNSPDVICPRCMGNDTLSQTTEGHYCGRCRLEFAKR